jgi:hypothetical protein
MAVYPTYTVDPERVKYRFGERYTSEATNQKFLGIPLGVYLGFTPSFDNLILTLSVDATSGLSLARVTSQDDPLYVVDVVLQEDVTLDFSNHNAFPVNVVVKVNGKLGFPHSAQILTQTAAPTYPTEILIGVVTGPNTIDVAEPFSRTTPYAYSGAPLGYGFMKDGAVEDLLAAVAINVEVAAARVDLSGVTRVSLDARLEEDASASAMAARLGKEIKTLRGGDFVIAAPTDTVNVSRAFSGYHRSLAGLTPTENFDGFASETRVGAITTGTVPDPAPAGALTDPERNACVIINSTTEARLTDSSRQVAYGRLVFDEVELTGTAIVFNNASTVVNGTGTAFVAEVSIGDIIEDPVSGDFFEVASITSNILLNISVVFPNATTPGATAPGVRRRFTLDARTRSGPDSETSFSMPASTVRVYFNAWTSTAVAQYDYLTELLKNSEEEPLPSATTSIAGKALVTTGISEGRAGSVFAVQQIGAQVGPAHVHTMEFDGATLGAPGVVNVTQRGTTGLPGNPGGAGLPGPVGPVGPQGQGFTNFNASNLFSESSVFDHTLLGSGALYSYTTAMSGSQILFLTGGNSEWYSPFIFDADDHWEITNISIVSGTTVRLNARVPVGGSPSAQVRFFLNAATR